MSSPTAPLEDSRRIDDEMDLENNSRLGQDFRVRQKAQCRFDPRPLEQIYSTKEYRSRPKQFELGLLLWHQKNKFLVDPLFV